MPLLLTTIAAYDTPGQLTIPARVRRLLGLCCS